MDAKHLGEAIDNAIQKLVPHPNTFAQVGLQQCDTAKTLKAFTKSINQLVKQRGNIAYIQQPSTSNNPTIKSPSREQGQNEHSDKRLRTESNKTKEIIVIDDLEHPEEAMPPSGVPPHPVPSPKVLATLPPPQVTYIAFVQILY